MIVSVHQPHYMPWAGYFDKIDCADVFVVLDSVQYEKNGWQNRNKIKTADGWMWLTVPVSGSTQATIADTPIAGPDTWRRKHLQAIHTNYGKAPYYDDHLPFFKDVYSRNWECLANLNIVMLRHFLSVLEIDTTLLMASEESPLPEEPSERLAEIVHRAGGDTYLAGAGSRSYLDMAPFDKAGIRVVFQDYEPVPYPQLFGDFIPALAVADLLLNTGPESRAIIRNGRRTIL